MIIMINLLKKLFKKLKKILSKNYQLIFIPSMRTPQKIIDLAKNFFNENQIIID